MNNRWLHNISGLLLGFVTPVFIGAVTGLLQGIQLRTFIWNVLHRIPYYNTYFQLGIAINIGIFFLIMKNEKAIHFGRGWLIATILSALWAVVIELS
jgi:hypothetical protein